MFLGLISTKLIVKNALRGQILVCFRVCTTCRHKSAILMKLSLPICFLGCSLGVTSLSPHDPGHNNRLKSCLKIAKKENNWHFLLV